MSAKSAFWLILGVVVLTILGGGTIYYFADQNLSTRAKEISKLKAQLEITELKINNARQAEADLERLSFIRDVAAKVLPPDKIQSDVVGDLSSFASSTGVELQSVSFIPTGEQSQAISQTEPLEGVSGVNALPITISITGSYSQVLNFLEKVETNRRKMQIESISLNPDPNTGTIGATLTINVYVKV